MTQNTDKLDVLIIGAGPIGLACAVEAKHRGMSYIVIEKGSYVHSITKYPTNMRFFSSAGKLEIGEVPFLTTEKPTRLQAMDYYRGVATRLGLRVNLYETVTDITGEDGDFEIITDKETYRARKVIAAIGYYERPRMMGIPGEDLEKVSHYFHEAHTYAGQDLIVIGGANSSVDAALECYRHGARVTMVIRRSELSQGVKYWVKPDIEARIEEGKIKALFETSVVEVKPRTAVLEQKGKGRFEIPNDFVLALTGYEPDFDFIRRVGIDIDEENDMTPVHDHETYETNRPGIYVAGVVAGGMCTNKWFIENSRVHAPIVMDHIQKNSKG